MRGLSLALCAVLVTAGCLGLSGSEEPSLASETGISLPPGEEDPDARYAQPGPLERPPTWIPGEWWTIQLTSPLLDQPLEFTRVVAQITTDTYLAGQPADESSPAPLVLHAPGLGEVEADTLAYSVHGEAFQPLSFPLEDGESWQTSFDGQPVQAKAHVDGEVARIEVCCKPSLEITYDPDVRAISEMTIDDGLATYTVLDHGFAYQGEVHVPLDQQLAFRQGRANLALTPTGDPAAPAEVVDVGEEAERVAFKQVVGSLEPAEASGTGVYVERAELPNGTTYTTEQAASTEGLQASFHDVANASGTWRFEHAAGGPGVAFTHGIAYTLETRVLD